MATRTGKRSRYILTEGDKKIFQLASNPRNGVGLNYFVSYYMSGRELKPWQWFFTHSSQLDLTAIAGTGSGKTMAVALSAMSWAAMTPKYAFMNLAPTAWQANIMAEMIMREAADKPYERFIKSHTTRPYPVITIENDLIGESVLYFMSADNDAKRIQGIEIDAANIDEAGQILNPYQLMGMVSTRMRGNVPVAQGIFRNRQKRLSMTTASYLESPPWLWDRMDKAITDPENFISFQVKSSESGTLSDEDIEIYKRRVPEDQQSALLDAERPIGRGVHFNLDTVTACEDMVFNSIMNYHVLENSPPTPDWIYDEAPGCGCVKYEKPPSSDRTYWMIGDPGQGNPPRRNSPAILVADMTEFPSKPIEIVAFNWIFGNGSYDPFKFNYQRLAAKYHPDEMLVDNTGQQSLWDEQIFLNLGLWVTGINFSSIKNGMLLALIQLIERRKILFPYVQGFRSQLVGYDLTRDDELAQDITVCFMMLAFHARRVLWQNVEEETDTAYHNNNPATLSSALNYRSGGVRTARTPQTVLSPEEEMLTYDGFIRSFIDSGFDFDSLSGRTIPVLSGEPKSK